VTQRRCLAPLVPRPHRRRPPRRPARQSHPCSRRSRPAPANLLRSRRVNVMQARCRLRARRRRSRPCSHFLPSPNFPGL